MFEVIYTKADYEPWWMFEGWEETIQSHHTFVEKEQAIAFFNDLTKALRSEHMFEATKKEIYHAFWSTNERTFCLGCDEDLQIYHGVIFKESPASDR